MREKFIIAPSLPKAYHRALTELYLSGVETDCPDWNCKQRELSLTFQVTQPLTEPRISRLFIGGPEELEQYRQEIIDGILDFEVKKGNWSYTYHKRYEKQIPFVIEELKRNPYSRRAILQIRDWKTDSKSNDPACLQHIQYFIRDNKLDCDVLFRSNDACKATFMNAFALICLQEHIAKELNVGVGTYTHRANSFHVYEKDYDLLYSYFNRIIKKQDLLTYNYLGEWDELMEDSKPIIAQRINELKLRTKK